METTRPPNGMKLTSSPRIPCSQSLCPSAQTQLSRNAPQFHLSSSSLPSSSRQHRAHSTSCSFPPPRRREQALHVLGQHVGFEIHGIARFQTGQRRGGERVRDQRHLECRL